MILPTSQQGYPQILGVNEMREENRAEAPYRCPFCGAPSWVEPSDQSPPADYCGESDHEEPDNADAIPSSIFSDTDVFMFKLKKHPIATGIVSVIFAVAFFLVWILIPFPGGAYAGGFTVLTIWAVMLAWIFFLPESEK